MLLSYWSMAPAVYTLKNENGKPLSFISPATVNDYFWFQSQCPAEDIEYDTISDDVSKLLASVYNDWFDLSRQQH